MLQNGLVRAAYEAAEGTDVGRGGENVAQCILDLKRALYNTPHQARALADEVLKSELLEVLIERLPQFGFECRKDVAQVGPRHKQCKAP